MKSFFFKCTALYDSFPIFRIFCEYIYISFWITAKLITDTFIHLEIIVPDMSVMYTYVKMICMLFKFNNENDLVYFQLNDVLIDWVFVALRPAQEYFTYMKTSPLPLKWLKI